MFSIDAMFAALIILVFFSFMNLKNYDFTNDKVLYNYVSSSLFVVSDELLSEDEVVINEGFNKTIPSFIDYEFEVDYYYSNLTLRKSLSGGNVSANNIAAVNKMFFSNNGFGIVVLKGCYYE